jgi:hypothetical protein
MIEAELTESGNFVFCFFLSFLLSFSSEFCSSVDVVFLAFSELEEDVAVLEALLVTEVVLVAVDEVLVLVFGSLFHQVSFSHCC